MLHLVAPVRDTVSPALFALYSKADLKPALAERVKNFVQSPLKWRGGKLRVGALKTSCLISRGSPVAAPSAALRWASCEAAVLSMAFPGVSPRQIQCRVQTWGVHEGSEASAVAVRRSRARILMARRNRDARLLPSRPYDRHGGLDGLDMKAATCDKRQRPAALNLMSRSPRSDSCWIRGVGSRRDRCGGKAECSRVVAASRARTPAPL